MFEPLRQEVTGRLTCTEQTLLANQIREGKMDRICGTHRRDSKCIQNFSSEIW
jgi:hypothetical protein